MRKALAIPSLRALWLGQGISVFGNVFLQIAAFWILQLRSPYLLVAAGVLVDRALAEGDRIFGFDVIDLPTVQNFGAECAFFDPRRRLLVVSDLVVAGAHGLMHYGEAFHADVTAVSLRAHLKRLMELEPTILLAGHGQDLTEDSARQLAELYRRG